MYAYVVSLMVLVALVNLVVGWLLGRLWPYCRTGSPDPGALRDAARHLAEQVARIHHDIHQHHGRVDQLNQNLLAVQSGEGHSMPSLLASVAEIVRINAGLQGRLLAAEAALKEKGDQIESWIAQARTDALTGLPNRRAFDDALARQLAEWRRTQAAFAVMLIDADHFKAINDRHGHSAGDFVLTRLAEILQASVRKMDLIARIGGEEFAVILPSTTGMSAGRAAEHCHAAVASHAFDRDEVELRLTVSIGIATVHTGDDRESLLRRADEALYAAKHAGRNCICLHNGNGCERVGPAGPCENVPLATAVAVPDTSGPQENGDLDAVCRDLRDRVAQLFTI